MSRHFSVAYFRIGRLTHVPSSGIWFSFIFAFLIGQTSFGRQLFVQLFTEIRRETLGSELHECSHRPSLFIYTLPLFYGLFILILGRSPRYGGLPSSLHQS